VYRPDVVRGPKHDAGDGGPALVRVATAAAGRSGVATWAAQPRLGAAHGRRARASPSRPISWRVVPSAWRARWPGARR
jgi:hypothetical protein